MKTSKADFSEFKKAFKEYVELFGLKMYTVYYYHEKIDGAYAGIEIDNSGMAAQVKLSTEVDKDWDNSRNSAKHEAIHLLISNLGALAQSRFITPDQVYEENERIVAVLEKVIK